MVRAPARMAAAICMQLRQLDGALCSDGAQARNGCRRTFVHTSISTNRAQSFPSPVAVALSAGCFAGFAPRARIAGARHQSEASSRRRLPSKRHQLQSDSHLQLGELQAATGRSGCSRRGPRGRSRLVSCASATGERHGRKPKSGTRPGSLRHGQGHSQALPAMSLEPLAEASLELPARHSDRAVNGGRNEDARAEKLI